MDKGSNCAECKKLVSDRDKGLQCGIHSEWFHLKLPEKSYDFLEIENVHWFCDPCNKNVGKVVLPSITLLNRRLD